MRNPDAGLQHAASRGLATALHYFDGRSEIGRREIGRQLGRRVQVPVRRLQIEGQAVPRQQCVALAPPGIVHRARRAAPRFARIGDGRGFVANAADQGESGLGLEQLCNAAVRKAYDRPP